MSVTGVAPSDPMGSFHLMMPGYGDGTTPAPMFTPDFLRALQPFSDIRFMDWAETNRSTVANWSDRVPPGAFSTDGLAGVPYEDMIELCNEAHKDMWINIPALATPAFVRDLAQLIDARLDPGLNVYVEYSNEVWNANFAAFSQAAQRAASNPLIGPSVSQYEAVADEAADLVVTNGQIFEDVFGPADAGRFRPILGGRRRGTGSRPWSSSSSSRISARRRSTSTRRPSPPTSRSIVPWSSRG